VRLLLRLPLLAAWTFMVYVPFVLTRPLGLISKSLHRATHFACVGTWARGVARILCMRITSEGTPPRGGFLLVANHLSYVDVILLLATCNVVLLSKAEVKHWPVLGLLARTTGTLFVDRSRKSDLPRAIATVEGALARGFGVVVFPEATSSDGSGILPFKPSLFSVAERLPEGVYWAVLRYETNEPDAHASDVVCWWGDMTFGPHFLRILRLRGFRAHVVFGPAPIRASDRKLLSAAVRADVVRAFRPMLRTPSLAPGNDS
jgi:1-acyl-sn-glycerol-3-phosphate acyltransferase